MHTRNLTRDLYGIEVRGAPATLSELLPGWHAYDRFGIVVHEPFGAVGASLLIQAAITRFFETRVEHRLGDAPAYPEVYAFHVGGGHGDLSVYDFWPGDKEVVVAADPVAVLHAVNERAITRLAVPSGVVREAPFMWPEHASATGRVTSCWAYSPDGDTSDADITVRALSAAAEANTAATLDIDGFLSELPTTQDTLLKRLTHDPDYERWRARVEARRGEVPREVRERIRARRQAGLQGGCATERFRRIGLDEALGRLVA